MPDASLFSFYEAGLSEVEACPPDLVFELGAPLLVGGLEVLVSYERALRNFPIDLSRFAHAVEQPQSVKQRTKEPHELRAADIPRRWLLVLGQRKFVGRGLGPVEHGLLLLFDEGLRVGDIKAELLRGVDEAIACLAVELSGLDVVLIDDDRARHRPATCSSNLHEIA